MTHDGRTIITPSGAEQHYHSAAAAAAADNSSTDSDLVPGIYEGGLKTWECALDLAAYLDRDVLGTTTTTTGEGQKKTRRTGTTIRGLRWLEAST
jgi:hypothetical protein